MSETDTQGFIDDLRQKRLQDPAVRNNGYCEKCDFRGYFKIANTNTVRSCECEINRLVTQRLNKVGVPQRWRGMAFDKVLQSEELDNYIPTPEGLIGLKDAYVEHLDHINAGELLFINPDIPPMRSVALVGGPRRIKSAWAAQIVEEKRFHSGAFAWFNFSELRSMLSDFKRLDEAEDFTWTMGNYQLVIIDGIYGGACAPGFPSAWDAAIAARQDSGLATILLCEDEYDIDSYAWRDMLEDSSTLVVTFRKNARSANTPPTTVQPMATTVPATMAREITTQDDAEIAILEYLGKNPDKIIKMIYDNILAPRDLVKAALDSLMSTGDVLKRQKPGKSGTMTVFYLRPEDTEATPPIASKQATLSELQEITGIPRTTLWRYRKAGQSDEDIIRRADGD